MRGILRRVSALHRGNAALVRATTGYTLAMLQDVDALAQRIEEEAGGGIATMQCAYAPEYASHSAGSTLRVE